MKRTIKPQSQRVKRILKHKAPKAIENDKILMYIQGQRSCERAAKLAKALGGLKHPDFISYNRKHDFRPFEDIKSLENMCAKLDASLFIFTQHSKKRPNSLTFGRLFDKCILDMYELSAIDVKDDLQIPNMVFAAKPYIVFIGDLFESNPVLKLLKNLWIDMFHGPKRDCVDLRGSKFIITFTATSDKEILLRSFVSESGLELTMIQPCADFTLLKSHIPSEGLLRLSMLQYELNVSKKDKKNKSVDKFGNKIGRVHKGSQNLDTLHLRRGKALKKNKVKPSASDAY